MLHLILGPDRLENSDALIGRICDRARQGVEGQILIVPEQGSHGAERALCARGGDSISRYAEVLSFTRLACRVDSLYGGVCEEYLDKGGRLLTVYRAAQQVLPEIRYFAAALTKAEFLQRLADAFEEFLSYALSPKMLLEAAQQLTGQFAQKTLELGILYESYLAVCAQSRNDPLTRLSRLADRLLEEPYAREHLFYIDGFSDFTGTQKKIIAALASQSAQVEICLTTDGSGRTAFQTANETLRQLKSLALSMDVPVSSEKVSVSPARSGENRLWLHGLFSGGDAVWPRQTPCVQLHRAQDVAGECNYAAAMVRKLTQKGLRCREICIAVTDEARYQSLLRATLARSGIAAFFAGSEAMGRTAPVSFVLACLRACERLDTEEVLQYLKSPFAPVTMEQADRLEQYAHLWGLRGAAWQQPWKLHPRGFGQPWTEKDEQALRQLNVWRESALRPLLGLRSAMMGAETAGRRLQALAAFFSEIGLRQALERQTQRLYAQGDDQNAQQTEQLYDILVDAMEQFWRVLGDLPMEQGQFTQLFTLLLSCYQVSSIPAACDEVQVGALAAMRYKRARAIIVLGAEESLLPAFAPQLGILTDAERQKLLNMGLQLAPAQQQRLEREMGWICSAFSAATETAALCFSGDAPSLLFTQTQAIFPQCPATGEADVCFFADAKSAAAACVRESQAEEEWASDELLRMSRSLAERGSYGFAAISPRTVRGLYGGEVQLSASKLDQFAACRLAYFYRYGLKAEPWKQAKLDAPVFGTFVHYVLEHTVREVMERGGFACLSEEQTQTIARRHIETFSRAYLQDLQNQPARYAYLFSRNLDEVRAVVDDVAAELRQSAFVPAAEELHFAEDGALPPIHIRTTDGDGVISGFVDRVDVLRDETGSYYRVVDYKTGGKDFDYASILQGEGLQMLIYLFALRNAPQTSGAQPAGVLYVPARYPMQRLEAGMGESEAEAARQKLLRRKGLLLCDEHVLKAMDGAYDVGRYLPVKQKKDGLTGDVATREQLLELEQFLTKQLSALTGAMLRGDVTPNPIIRGPMHSSCQFCDYKTACHRDACRHENRYIASITAREFWQAVEKEDSHG